ncbi:MAG TPA: metallophosphoesterase [Desulfobacteraceae bacterium]|nr:metallophosphoesterase [Desulfobacteraceae bacterium]
MIKCHKNDRLYAMRMAVISDIHGNLEAFKQVLMDIGKSDIDDMICLGDNIGYGPEPEQVVAMIKNHNIQTVMGNHELAVLDQNYLSLFNPLARKSLLRTTKLLSEETINFISGLEPFLSRYECRFVHGFPPDSASIYLFQVSEDELLLTFKQMKERICFLGHTHRLEIIDFNGEIVTHASLTNSITTLNRDHKYIINIGSVGQPRDGNNSAKYVIWDSLNDTIEVKFIPYDIVSVIEKIIAAGLPIEHAVRLL